MNFTAYIDRILQNSKAYTFWRMLPTLLLAGFVVACVATILLSKIVVLLSLLWVLWDVFIDPSETVQVLDLATRHPLVFTLILFFAIVNIDDAPRDEEAAENAAATDPRQDGDPSARSRNDAMEVGRVLRRPSIVDEYRASKTLH